MSRDDLFLLLTMFNTIISAANYEVNAEQGHEQGEINARLDKIIISLQNIEKGLSHEPSNGKD